VHRDVVGRYYDPATGQFLSVDPLVDETGQPYSYSYDDPVNGRDPFGLGWGWGPISDIVQGWNDTGGKVVSYEHKHWKGTLQIAAAVAGGVAVIATTGGVGLIAIGGVGVDFGEGIAATGIGIAESGEAAGGLVGGAQAFAGQVVANVGSSIMWAGAGVQATGEGVAAFGVAAGNVATVVNIASTAGTCVTEGLTPNCAGSAVFSLLGAGSAGYASFGSVAGWAAIGNAAFGAATGALGQVNWNNVYGSAGNTAFGGATGGFGDLDSTFGYC
jgi:hypothetical protein